MNSENNPNANVTGTTSPSGPGSKSPADQAAEREKASEADYITREQDRAKAAIANVIGNMKQSLASGADIKEWARLHPWVMVGGAAVAGVAAAMVLIPSKSRRRDAVSEFFGDHWQEIKGKLNELTPAGAAAAVAAATAATSATAAQVEGAAQVAKPKAPSMIGNLLSEVFKIVGPTLGGLVSGAIAGNQKAQEEVQDGNGHAQQAPADYRTSEGMPRT